MDIEKKVNKMNEEQKSKKHLFILILGVLTVLVALVGASFAYFTTVVNNTKGNQSIVLETTTLEGVTYKSSDNLTLLNALPGDSTETTFTVTNPNSSAKVRYTLKVIADLNEFTNIEGGDEQVLIKATGGNLNTTKILDFTNGAEIKEGTLVSNVELNAKESDVYKIRLEFAENNINQNINQKKTFAGHIEITQSIVVE